MVKKYLLVDCDGPLNNIAYVMNHYEIIKKQWKAENNSPDQTNLHVLFMDVGLPKPSFYMNNVRLLKATFDLLQPDVVCILASQRVTYGYAQEYILGLIEKRIQGDQGTPLSEEDKSKGKIVILDVKGAEGLGGVLFGEKQLDNIEREKLAEIRKTITGNYTGDLAEGQPGEKILRDAMYTGLDLAFGNNRAYLTKQTSAAIGQSLALAEGANSTGKTKWTYLEHATNLPELDDEAKALISKAKEIGAQQINQHPEKYSELKQKLQETFALVDDDPRYAETFPGLFVHAVRDYDPEGVRDYTKPTAMIDSAYCATLLVGLKEEKALWEGISELFTRDQQTAAQLTQLCLIKMLPDENVLPDRINSQLDLLSPVQIKLLDLFKQLPDDEVIKSKMLAQGMKHLKNIVANFKKGAITEQEFFNLLSLSVLASAAKVLNAKTEDQKNNIYSTQQQKATIRPLIKWVMNNAQNINFVVSLIKEIDEDRYLFLKQHEGVGVVFGGVTNTYSSIVESAQEKILQLIKDYSSQQLVDISSDEYAAIKQILTMPTAKSTGLFSSLNNQEKTILEEVDGLIAKAKHLGQRPPSPAKS